jgi:hypothetical protein
VSWTRRDAELNGAMPTRLLYYDPTQAIDVNPQTTLNGRIAARR